MTGIANVKLIPIYKFRTDKSRKVSENRGDGYYEYRENYHYFMAGIDYMYGYNMVNVAHYDTSVFSLSI